MRVGKENSKRLRVLTCATSDRTFTVAWLPKKRSFTAEREVGAVREVVDVAARNARLIDRGDFLDIVLSSAAALPTTIGSRE